METLLQQWIKDNPATVEEIFTRAINAVGAKMADECDEYDTDLADILAEIPSEVLEELDHD
jgi:hypothetical protein